MKQGWGGWRGVLWVATRKELREIVRDKRSLYVLLLLPIVLYPLLLIGGLLAANSQISKLAKAKHVVWVQGLDRLDPELKERLAFVQPLRGQPEKKFRLTLSEAPPEDEWDDALVQQRVAAILPAVPRLVRDKTVRQEIRYNGARDASTMVSRGIARTIAEWRQTLVEARIREEKIALEALQPIVTARVDRGRPGALAGRTLSLLVVILALSSAFYPALDLGAGEKERGTLETWLLAPVPRVVIALGKVGATFILAITSAALNLLSLGLTFASAARFTPGGLEELQLSMGLGVPIVMLVVLVPLVLLFSALSLALATFAASYKEGQAYLTPVMALGTLPAMAAALPGLDLTPTLALVPVLGAVLLMKGLLAGTAGALDAGLVFGSSLAYAALGVRWVAALYEREEVLWRPAAAQAPDLFGLRRDTTQPVSSVPTLPQAVLMGIVALLLLWFVGISAQSWNLPVGLALTLIGLVALPAVAYAWWLRTDLRETFALRRPPALALAAALALGIGCLVFNMALREWLALDGPAPENMKALETQIASWPAVLTVLLIAVLPALCEETLCRGFLLSGLRKEGGAVAAVIVSAIFFAALHLDPNRLLQTFLVGLILAILVLRSGSIWPACLLHFVNNAGALALGTWGMEAGLLAENELTKAVNLTPIAYGIGATALLAGIAGLILTRP
ncbi:MAG: CPBP family intramembrane metalloprotease, partial [Planctomycetes bacterium]|nr:CPBP family intramembrane metalloprotease [Planctomycetota bacterium]